MPKRVNEEKYANVTPLSFTVSSFINNPTGDVGSRTFARKLTLEAYENKYKDLIKKHGEFKYKFYTVGTSLYCHVEVPSETLDKLYYDVLIEFLNVNKNDSTLLDKNIRFFSNSPGFAYTYAHTFDMYGIFSTRFVKHYPKEIFTLLPVKRNPNFYTFYEKSIMFALFLIRDKDLMTGGTFNQYTVEVPPIKFLQRIMALEDKEAMIKVFKENETRIAKEKKQITKDTNAVKKVVKNIDKVKSGRKVKSKNAMFIVQNKVDNRVSNKVNNKVNNKVKK